MKFYKETNFKETPIGKIPKEWSIPRLEDVCEKVKAGGTPLTRKKEFWNGNLPFVKIEDMTLAGKYLKETKEFISKEGLNNSSAWLVPESSLLFAMYGSMGEVSINKISVTTNQAILGIIPKNKSDVEFLYYWFSFFKPKWKKYAKPTTQANLTAEIVRNSIIPFPSREERQAIVEVLSRIDWAIRKVDEAIAKAERLKKGLMQQLLTKGIGHKEFKETPIGKIPKNWEAIRLGDALELCQYGLSIPMSEKGRYPIIKMDEIVDGYVIPTITKYVDLDYKTFKAFKLEKGDILFNRTNAYELVGRTGIFLLDGDYVFASYLIRLRPKHELFDPHFLTFYLTFSQNRLRQLATKAVHQANINATNLKKIVVPKPPLPEQQKIAEILSSIDDILRLKKEKKEKLVRMKRRLMDSLLTGRVRVSL